MPPVPILEKFAFCESASKRADGKPVARGEFTRLYEPLPMERRHLLVLLIIAGMPGVNDVPFTIQISRRLADGTDDPIGIHSGGKLTIDPGKRAFWCGEIGIAFREAGTYRFRVRCDGIDLGYRDLLVVEKHGPKKPSA